MTSSVALKAQHRGAEGLDMTMTTGIDHHHHWVLVDGYTSVYECACGATRGDRTVRPGEPASADRRRRRLPRVRLAHRS